MFTENDIIYSYTRKQAIADGEQVEVDNMGRFKFPVYITRVVNNIIQRTIKNSCSDLEGVLWDIYTMATSHLAKKLSPSEVKFTVRIGRKDYELFMACGATDIDDPSPRMTVMVAEDR